MPLDLNTFTAAFYVLLCGAALWLAWMHRADGLRYGVPGLLFIALELVLEAIEKAILALTFVGEVGSTDTYVLLITARIVTVLRYLVLLGVVLAIREQRSAAGVRTVGGAARFILTRGR